MYALLLVLDLVLLLLLGGSRGVSRGTTSDGGGRGGTATGADVGQELLDVLALERLGEQGRPDGLELNLGGRGESDELVGGDLDALVGEDEGGVGGGELGLQERKGSGSVGWMTEGQRQRLIALDRGAN